MNTTQSHKPFLKIPYKGNFCQTIFFGQGVAPAGSEMEAWVAKYEEKALRLPIGYSLDVNYDTERFS